jgi:hypothetical protein
MVLADMLLINKGIALLNLDDNAVGQRGGRAVLRVLRQLSVDGTKKVTLQRCNMTLVDKDSIGATKMFDRNADARADAVEEALGSDPPGDLKVVAAEFTPDWVLDPDPLSRGLFDPAKAAGRHLCDLDDAYGRMVAWNLVELSWAAEESCIQDAQLDGSAYSIDQPDKGQIWSRVDFALADTGMLALTFVPPMRVPKSEDAVVPEFTVQLRQMMSDMPPSDALRLLKLAAMDFFFCAECVGLLLQALEDGKSRVEALSALLSRIVSCLCVPWYSGSCGDAGTNSRCHVALGGHEQRHILLL